MSRIDDAQKVVGIIKSIVEGEYAGRLSYAVRQAPTDETNDLCTSIQSLFDGKRGDIILSALLVCMAQVLYQIEPETSRIESAPNDAQKLLLRVRRGEFDSILLAKTEDVTPVMDRVKKILSSPSLQGVKVNDLAQALYLSMLEVLRKAVRLDDSIKPN